MVPRSEIETFGFNAYDAYGESVGWKNGKGERLPEWNDLRRTEQLAWQSAAQVCIDRALDNPKAAKVASNGFLAPITTI